MKRPLPDLLAGPLVAELLKHHSRHFGGVHLQEPEAEGDGIAIHIGRRKVAQLVSETQGPELQALALALDALLKQEEAMRKIHRSFADRVMALGERLNRAEQELSGPMHQQAEQILKQGGALEEAATTCSLTGVLNRRGLEMNLSAAAEDSVDEGVSLAVMMVDVDHFKSINDNFGHLVGDRVLALLGRELLVGRRRNDVIGRWGGEEFMLALLDCTLSDAEVIAESIRERIESMSVETDQGQLRFTASIGLAIGQLDTSHLETDAAAGPAEALVSLADQQLYAAKEGGRNQVMATVLSQ
ncbi:MAG: GGDEF domain-containing protein [Myxococcota bacterium]|nr:GGDEF domain-containing protein [Myxococcota bacterium]